MIEYLETNNEGNTYDVNVNGTFVGEIHLNGSMGTWTAVDVDEEYTLGFDEAEDAGEWLAGL
jgi:hypothetical protein